MQQMEYMENQHFTTLMKKNYMLFKTVYPNTPRDIKVVVTLE